MIQNHLTSQPLSKRLKELGVPQKSYFVWATVGIEEPTIIKSQESYGGAEVSAAFLSSELGEILGEGFSTAKECGVWEALSLEGSIYDIEGSLDGNEGFISENEAEARGLMFEYLILNGLIKL